MKIVKSSAPYIRRSSSVKRMMLDVLIALIPVVGFSTYQYGLKAIVTLIVSLVIMIASECVFVYLTNQMPYDGEKKKFSEKVKYAYSKASINNILSASISAIIYALIMPASYEVYKIAIGALLGIVIGKLVFGGLGNNIFNPAALGRVITMLCFGSMEYQSINSIGGAFDVFVSGTPLANLKEEITHIDFNMLKNLFLGTVSGSMGEVCKIAIILGAIYLIIRKSCDFRPMLVSIATFMLLMLIAGIKKSDNALMYMLYQVLSGGLLFGAVFMITDPVTSPITRPGRIIFGMLMAIIVCFIRLFGSNPEGVAFAILIANAFVPVIDYYKWSTNKYNYKHIIIFASLLIIPALIIFFAL